MLVVRILSEEIKKREGESREYKTKHSPIRIPVCASKQTHEFFLGPLQSYDVLVLHIIVQLCFKLGQEVDIYLTNFDVSITHLSSDVRIGLVINPIRSAVSCKPSSSSRPIPLQVILYLKIVNHILL